MSVQILGWSYDIDIKKLYLYSKGISELPESIGKLVNLQILYLVNNQLKNLPESIDKLIRLQGLYLENNKLTTLPESIGKLVNLKELQLVSNQLTTLPESIGKLVKLEYLSLENNRLTILPASILNIKLSSLRIYTSTYEIDNLLPNTEFLIFSYLDKELTNLPTGLKEIWIKYEKEGLNHKLPFGCVIKYF
jgi:Leucine-rich repeat (LRR) protein